MITEQELCQKEVAFNQLMTKLRGGKLSRKDEIVRLSILQWQVQNKVHAFMSNDGSSTKFFLLDFTTK